MARKKKEVKFVCESCGKVQEPDGNKSTGTWAVYSTKCSECGGKVEMILEE